MYLELTYRIIIKSHFAASHSAAAVFSVSSGIWKKSKNSGKGKEKQKEKQKEKVKVSKTRRVWRKRMEIQQSMLCALYPQKILKRNAS